MSQQEDNLTRAFDSAVKFVAVVSRILWEGSKKFSFDRASLLLISSILLLIYLQTKKMAHLGFIYWCLPSDFTAKLLLYFAKNFSFWSHFALNVFAVFGSYAFFIGLRPYWEFNKLQKSIDRLNLKNGLDVAPKLKRVKMLDPYRKELTLYSPGIGIERFEEKKGSLQTSFGAKIEQFIENYEHQGIKIILTTKFLPISVPFKKISEGLKGDGQFLIGESERGVQVESIKELPHVLIAGSTGGGKSVFLKQMLLGLLKSTPKLQMYLIDLKGGLELIDFKPLFNVRIVKTERDAVILLRRVHQEMKSRFDYLEKNKLKVIEPNRDKKDRIVIAIDESSVLYTKSGNDELQSKMVAEARYLTDEIAKLSRAAGIHLILATQKVSKETVDTKVQENMSGKMCFKMNTIQGSVAILGNKMAHELPLLPGRGLWSLGNQMTEVQAPMLTEKELEEEIQCLQKEFEKKQIYQTMMEVGTAPKGEKMQFNDLLKTVAND